MKNFYDWLDENKKYTPWGTVADENDPSWEELEEKRKMRRVNRILELIDQLDDDEFDMLMSKIDYTFQKKREAV